MPAPHPRMHGLTHVPGGPDPIPGLLPAGSGSINLAVTAPGSLLYRYQLGEASGAALDTSGFAGGPRNLTYTEYTAGSDPGGGAHSTWDGTQAATRDRPHTEFGAGDDGAVRLNYNQLHAPGAGPFSIGGNYASIVYPGAEFTGANTLAEWGGTNTKSLSVFFKPTAGGTTTGVICGRGVVSAGTWLGWWLTYTPSTNIAAFHMGYTGGGFGGADILASPGALTPGQWYHCVVTLNGTTWTMYLNGVSVATATASYSTAGATNLEIGAGTIYANINFPGDAKGFFWGEVDEIDGYSIVLTLAQVQAIFAAGGGAGPVALPPAPGDATQVLLGTGDYGIPAVLAVDTQTGTSYTLVLADGGKLVTLSNASAVALTVPTNASVAYAVGTSILLMQLGAGQVTVAGAGGVTVNSRGSALKIAGQYGVATLIKTATDTWVLTGDVTT